MIPNNPIRLYVDHFPTSVTTSLIHVNRQIYEEASPILYAHIRETMGNERFFVQFQKCSGKRPVVSDSHLSLDFMINPPHLTCAFSQDPCLPSPPLKLPQPCGRILREGFSNRRYNFTRNIQSHVIARMAVIDIPLGWLAFDGAGGAYAKPLGLAFLLERFCIVMEKAPDQHDKTIFLILGNAL